MAPSGKAQLAALEQSGRYLFHGSGQEIEVFEPRQAQNFVDGQNIDDDKPGVHASPVADIAIFMGLIHRQNCPRGSYCRFGFTDGKLLFEATQKTLDQLYHPEGREIRGHVYVFDKAHFQARDDIEWICYEPIRAEQCIELGIADLPENIVVIPVA